MQSVLTEAAFKVLKRAAATAVHFLTNSSFKITLTYACVSCDPFSWKVMLNKQWRSPNSLCTMFLILLSKCWGTATIRPRPLPASSFQYVVPHSGKPSTHRKMIMRASLNSPQADTVCESSASWCMFAVGLYVLGSMPVCAESVLPLLTPLANVWAVPQDTSRHGSTLRHVTTRQYLKTRRDTAVP
jgi:hypothetical protein